MELHNTQEYISKITCVQKGSISRYNLKLSDCSQIFHDSFRFFIKVACSFGSSSVGKNLQEHHFSESQSLFFVDKQLYSAPCSYTEYISPGYMTLTKKQKIIVQLVYQYLNLFVSPACLFPRFQSHQRDVGGKIHPQGYEKGLSSLLGVLG